jgi:eukaryotic-like serine/threonine-protein kinase
VRPPKGELGRSRALAEGASFANYAIIGLLGSGGLARVYRAQHQTLGHEVALKIFEPATAPGPSGVARFFREAHLAASVRHPHVVQTLDAGVHQGLPFLVMELLEGCDLETHLRAEHALEELALIELVIPIVAGLMALHAQGLVHGDLGPGNVFLVRTPQRPDTAKLLDIGISKPHRRLRLTAAARQQLMGSPLYMAPEAMLGHELTPASDQYSLGLILYECVTGVNPFVATSLKESVRLIIAGQRLAVLEQSVAPSPGLANIIERALNVDPAERFPDLASLGRALLRLADQRTRAGWEFSFQSEPMALPALASRRGAATPAAPGAASRWGVSGVAVAVLGWATAAVVAFVATRHESDQSYVMLGPPATTAPLQQRLALRAPPVATGLAPCPEVASGGSAVGEASALGGGEASALGGSDKPLDTQTSPVDVASSLPVQEVLGEGGAAPLGQAEAAAPESSWPAGDSQQTSPKESSSHEDRSQLPARGTNNAPIFD